MIELEQVERAAADLVVHGVRTPVLVSSALDELLGATVLCKAESRQRSGSFKFRGAMHRLSQIPDDERDRGVVAVSSGNHGAAVAVSAAMLGIRATVFVPADAPAAKVALIESAGAELVTFDRRVEDREAIPRALAAERGATFVHPFEDPFVMAGQGTVALELHRQVGDLDALLVPMSGGGLMAGCASAMRALSSSCRMVGVEPANAADTAASFEAGHRIRIPQPDTIADGLAVTSPGAATFAINIELVDEVITVEEDEILDAMRLLRTELNLYVEPSGAVGVAALLGSATRWRGQRLGVVLSGGNIDRAVFHELVD